MPPTFGRALALCSILTRGLAAAGSRHPLVPPAFLPYPLATFSAFARPPPPSPSRPTAAANWPSTSPSHRDSPGGGARERGREAVGAGCRSSRSSSRRRLTTTMTATAAAGGTGASMVPSSAKLDRALFTERRTLQALRVPAARCNEVIQVLSPYLFRTNRIRSVVLPTSEGGTAEGRLLERGQRLVLLQTEAEVAAAEKKREEGGAPRRTAGQDPFPVLLERVLASIDGSGVVEYEVELGYDDLPLDQVLRRLLPAGVEAPSAFETVGHIAHLNLRNEVLPYKHLVAQAILDKNPRLRTVVNKVASLDSTDNPFRVLPLEIIGGDGETNVEVREGGAVFRFDFAEVYWNSRLQAEHARVVDLIAAGMDGGGVKGKERGKGKGKGKGKAGEQPLEPAAPTPPRPVVWDVFAGVGPFAVPLAMRGCHVYANDLNARSHHYLHANARANKVDKPDRLVPSNLDGRAFLLQMAEAKMPCDHMVMNLPALAIEFLDVFAGAEGKARFGYLLLDGEQQQQQQGPTIHVYCFSKAADPERDALDRVARALGLEGTRRLEKVADGSSGVRIHHVRDVAPKKPMFCLSFPLRLAWEG